MPAKPGLLPMPNPSGKLKVAKDMIKVSRSTFWILILQSLVLTTVFVSVFLTSSLSRNQALMDEYRQMVQQDLSQLMIQSNTLLFSQLQNEKLRSDSVFYDDIKNHAQKGLALARAIYSSFQNVLSDADIQKLIIETLRKQQFFGDRGYYFVHTMDYQVVLYPPATELEGMSLYKIPGERGSHALEVYEKLRQRVVEDGEGFVTYDWETQEKTNAFYYKKLVYTQGFAPFNWIIGTGDYLDLRQLEHQRQYLDNLTLAETNPQEHAYQLHAFVWDLEAKQLILGKSHYPVNAQGVVQTTHLGRIELAPLLQQLAENPQATEAVITYGFASDSPKELLVYYQEFAPWKVILGQLLPKQQVHLRLVTKQQELTANFDQQLGLMGAWVAGVMLLSILLIMRIQKRLSNTLQDISNKFDDASQNFTPLDPADIKVEELLPLAQSANHMVLAIGDQNQQLRYQNTHDQLTGLPNRTALFGHIQALTQDPRRQEFHLVYADLDHFKQINDRCGHQVGDEVLQLLAQRLQQFLPVSIYLARIGGDEFVMVIPLDTLTGTMDFFAQEIQKLVQKPLQVKDNRFRLSVSLGIASYPLHGETAEELMRNVDIALYEVKGAQRSGYKFYDQSIGHKVEAAIAMESSMRAGLDNDEFFIVFQPQIEAINHRVKGVEVLVRWHHPQLGFIPPDLFIPIAERSGFIHDLGLWVLHQALAQQAKWQQDGLNLHFAVNLSPRQFDNQNLLEDVRRLLEDFHTDPRTLSLEITESVSIQQEQNLKTLQALDQLGVVLELDDFGTGYSSLSYLNSLPLEFIKIDRSFIQKMLDSERNTSLVKAIVEMAFALKMKVVAEGVETPAQIQALQALGCHYYQGFYFAKPLPEAEFIKWLEDYPRSTKLV